MLNVSAGDGERHQILRLAGGRACVATDATSVVDNFSPFHGLRLNLGLPFVEHDDRIDLVCQNGAQNGAR
ncbi:MAG: hypothetical protein ABR568_06155 [Pyrinomonadaceae bacterium]